MTITRRAHRLLGLVLVLPICAWAATGLVRTDKGWMQLDAATAQPRSLADETELRRLVEDAFVAKCERYGEITTVKRQEGESPSAAFETTTGVEIELDWNTLGMQQSGRDTRRIDALYRVHYLQWTGLPVVDRVAGVAGLGSLLVLGVFGVRLAFARR